MFSISCSMDCLSYFFNIRWRVTYRRTRWAWWTSCSLHPLWYWLATWYHLSFLHQIRCAFLGYIIAATFLWIRKKQSWKCACRHQIAGWLQLFNTFLAEYGWSKPSILLHLLMQLSKWWLLTQRLLVWSWWSVLVFNTERNALIVEHILRKAFAKDTPM